MAVEVRLGQLGESVIEGTVARWLVAEGEQVDRDQPLLEVETDKATVEVPAPTKGVLTRRVAEQGAVVKVGEVLGELDGEPEASTETRHSPAVRRLAEEHGVDLSRIKGTGANGRVTKDDVMKAVSSLAPTSDVEIVPWSSRRKLIAQHMAASKRTSPHVACVAEVDFSHVLRTREGMASRPSLTAFVGEAICKTLAEAEFRVLNANVDHESTHLHQSVHLAIAVDAAEGLMAPVIRDAHRLTVEELDVEISRLAELVRGNRVRPDDLRGGTFTISNPGKWGNLYGIAILNQPQVAILRMGALVKRAVVVEETGTDRIVVRPMMYLALSYDHRVVDGRPANHFLHRLKETLEGG